MKDYPVIKFTVAFIVGILALQLVKISIFLVAVIFFLNLGLFLLSICKVFNSKYQFLQSILLLLLISSIGNLSAYFNQKHFNPVLEKLYKEKNVIVSGTIKEIELKREFEVLFIIEADEFVFNDDRINDRMQFLCKLRAADSENEKFYREMKPGYRIELKGRYSKGRERRNPGEFDYNNYLHSAGITGIVTIDDLNNIDVIDDSPYFFSNIIFQIRKKINDEIISLHSIETSALLRGLLLADRREIDSETKTQFINSGVVHVLAVSGLHVGFIALIFMVLFGRFNIYARSILTIIGLLAFMFVTGIPPSVFRATVMAVVIIVAFLTNRSTNIFNSLSIAAMIILIINPDEIYSPGFQLSFSAVIAIGIIYPIISIYIHKLNLTSKFIRYLLLFAAVSFSAQIGTLPFTLIYFGKLSVISLISNLIVIPAIGIIIALAVITLCTNWLLPFLASVYALANELITNVVLLLIDFTGRLNFSHLSISNYSIYDAIVFYLLVFFIIYFIKRFKNKFAILLLVLLTFTNIYLYSMLDDEDILPDNILSVMMIDVGQGDAFLIKFPDNRTALIDAGEATLYFDNGENVILPLLQYLGIDKIDYGFVSHIDLDHYGGFVSLVACNKISQIYKPALDTSLQKDIRFQKFLDERNIPYTFYKSQILNFDNSRIYILSDAELSRTYNLSSNNSSGILKIVYGETSFLFMGDAESRVEKLLIEDYQDFLDVDVLKVGHHGSKTGSCDDFIKITSPNYALISVGIQNKFGHPDGNIISRLEGKKVKILRTDLSGGILLNSNGEKIFVKSWR